MPDAAQMEEMKKKMQTQMAQVQDMLEKNPEMQKQVAERMQEMQQFAGNKELYEELEKDPELEDFFKTIKSEGPAALFRYMNDPVMLKKFADKMGERGMVPPAAQAAAQAASSAAEQAPQSSQAEQQVETLLDAAKFGDLEAVEDFLAVGKDINMSDPQERTPLHYAVAHKQGGVIELLLKEGADLAARDEKGNSPVHYAAGYGRVAELRLLKDAGADVSLKNSTGKTALDIAKLDGRNPVNNHKDLMDWLKSA